MLTSRSIESPRKARVSSAAAFNDPAFKRLLMQTETTTEEHAIYQKILKRKMLSYGFTVSLLGLAVGFIMKLPYVWGLSILGIVIGGIKLHLSKKDNR
jgi:hypothetical protein